MVSFVMLDFRHELILVVLQTLVLDTNFYELHEKIISGIGGNSYQIYFS
jgi:hypothetical protein